MICVDSTRPFPTFRGGFAIRRYNIADWLERRIKVALVSRLHPHTIHARYIISRYTDANDNGLTGARSPAAKGEILT